MRDSMSSTITNVHDFLQDAQGFLEQTLASEKLSRSALEQRTRLITKLSTLIKEYENHHQMQLYIDMSPTLKSFFQSSDGSTSDNSSLRDQVPVNEEFYDVPHGNMSYDADQPTIPEDESDAPVFPPLPLAMETKKMGFMQRLLKPRNKTSDSFSLTAAKNQNRSAPKNVKEGEDDQSRRESGGDTEYDDAVTVRVSRADSVKEEPATYDDVSGFLTLTKNSNKKSVTSKTPPNLDLYDDASQVIANKEPEEDYEYVLNDAQESHNNNNDSDKVSMKSGISNYGASVTSHRWHIPASDAKSQALRYGCMKRRNGRKLLSAWRNCYSILLPAHLLMYAGEGDHQPRVVIDLSEPNIRVKRMVKQGVDSKRLKTHPFVLLHEDRPLYEMSTKSREETEEWIVALQAILIQVGDSQDTKPDKIDDDDDSFYNDIPENIQQRDIQSRMESIQGRNLPSLPAKEQEKTSQSQQKPLNKVNIRPFFQRGRSSSSEEEQSFKRQSVDSSTNTDDVYQELPSPTASGTPYSSLDSLKGSSEDIYYNVEEKKNVTNNLESYENIQQSQRVPDRSLRWPTPPPEDDIPVYDIPSPTIRPLSTVSVKSEIDETVNKSSFASLISQSRNIVLQRKISKSGSVTVVSSAPEVYDVPASKPRPISMTKESELETSIAYDHVPTPLRTFIPSSEINVQPPPPTSQMNKFARSWKDKLDKPLTNFKKETSPPTKCLPKPSTETKSVGRCFSRTSPPRTPLASLTELLASKNGVVLKPSALKMNAANIKENTTTDPAGTAIGIKLGTKPSISLKPKVTVANNNSFINKKDPPPRPPAPIRSPNKTSEPSNITDELSRKLMQRAMKSEQGSEPVTKTEVKDNATSGLKEVKEQYKARWAYVATNPLELSINSGDIVHVISKTDPNWLVQAPNNKKGLVPKDYLVPITKKVLSLTKIGDTPITV